MSKKLPILAALAAILPGSAYADFDTALAFGDANPATDTALDGINNRASGTLFSPGAGTYEITSGGADFWGGNDRGTVIYDSTGTYTTTGDLTATVRHVMTTPDNAPNWGRAMISARKTTGNAAAGVPEANDTHFGAFRRSNQNAALGTIRRTSDGGATRRATTRNGAMDGNLESDQQDQMLTGGFEYETAQYFSVGRQGNRWWTGFATDLGGAPGRFVAHYALDAGVGGSAMNNAANQTFAPLTGANATRDNVGIAVGEEVTVVLGHQAHNQAGLLAGATDTASPNDGGRVNTATLDQFTFTDSFDASVFNPAASGSTWQVDGSVDVVGGEVVGSAFVRDYVNNGGNATGEAVKWTVSAFKLSSFVPSFGSAGDKKDPTAMEAADLVSAANFRYDSDGAGNYLPGLNADLYSGAGQGNTGTTADKLGVIAGAAPSGSLVVSDVNFNNDATNGYYRNDPLSAGGFPAAVPGAFTGNQEQYLADFHGEIFIPANGGKLDVFEQATGLEYVTFEEGTDDFSYLEIDGQVITDNNDWSSTNSTANGGGHIAIMDVSDPKYDDGEWVDFRFVMGEGGGGDLASLYWDVTDANDTFDLLQIPGSFTDAPVSAGGFTQVGDESSTGSFGVNLTPGIWLVTLEVSNTGTEQQFPMIVEVLDGGPGFAITSIAPDFGAGTVGLTWNSEPGAFYAIESSTTAELNEPNQPGDWEEIEDNIASGGTETTQADVPLPAGPTALFRIRRTN